LGRGDRGHDGDEQNVRAVDTVFPLTGDAPRWRLVGGEALGWRPGALNRIE
jgi:hypothetical protein